MSPIGPETILFSQEKGEPSKKEKLVKIKGEFVALYARLSNLYADNTLGDSKYLAEKTNQKLRDHIETIRASVEAEKLRIEGKLSDEIFLPENRFMKKIPEAIGDWRLREEVIALLKKMNDV